MIKCENCSAPLHGTICKYCGSKIRLDADFEIYESVTIGGKKSAVFLEVSEHVTGQNYSAICAQETASGSLYFWKFVGALIFIGLLSVLAVVVTM